MSQTLVHIDNVSLFLPGDPSQTLVLHAVNWRIERGAHCALLGPNGAGKSTLLRLLRGELWPAAGRMSWHTAQGAEESPLAGRAMSALVSPAQQENYQRQAWDITGRELLLTAFDDSPLLYSLSPPAREDEAESLARGLQVLGLLDRSIPTLSQGQLRLLLLGRALLRKPALLLLDEYAAGLDQACRQRVFALLEQSAQTSTVIMTAHRPGDIPAWCAGRRYLRQGHLLIAPPAAAQAGPLPEGKNSAGDAAAKYAEKAAGGRAHDQQNSEPLLALEGVTVFIERHEVLHHIDWQMHQGEHWRIAGANGSGKSTLLRLLAGDEFVAAGGSLRRRLPGQGGVDTLCQVRGAVRLVSDLSQAMYDFSLTALELTLSGLDNSEDLYREFSEAEHAQALHSLSHVFPELGPQQVTALAGRSIRQLSSGQLRRLFLGRALMGSPDILLLDEPCSGLDAHSRSRYLALLDELVGRNGVHLVYVSHYGEEAPLCINREARMEGGRLTVLR